MKTSQMRNEFDAAIQGLEELLTPKKPVSFKEFVESPDFCGLSSVYPFWIEEISNLPLSTNELIVTGSLGGGKSFGTSLYAAYRLYCLCFDGPIQDKFSLDDSSPVYIIYFSVSMAAANRSGFKYLYNTVKNCNWFKANMPIDESITSRIVFKDKNIEIIYGSAEGHQIGLNVIMFILDEANFRSGVGSGSSTEYVEVTNLYTQLLDRQLSRFSTPEGSSALAILVSSASYQSSFTNLRIEESKNNPNAKVIIAIAYKIRPQQYSKETFEVFIGTATLEPKVIESAEQKQMIINQLKESYSEDLFIQVPVTLKTQYQRNIVLALQNHSGVSVQLAGRFLKNLNVLKESYTNDEPSWFIQDQITISSGDEVEIQDYFIPENVIHPHRPHSFFLDLSLAGDSGGFSCYRYDGIENNVEKHTHVFTLEIIPPDFPFQTRIKKILNFMIYINSVVNVVAFGTDNFQSVNIRQDVQAELDLTDIRISIDSSDIFHLKWANALLDKSLRQRYNKKLETEVAEAEIDYKRHRVVKRSGSSDDLFQATVGAYYLSSVVGSDSASLDDITRVNVVGINSARKFEKMVKNLGFK